MTETSKKSSGDVLKKSRIEALEIQIICDWSLVAPHGYFDGVAQSNSAAIPNLSKGPCRILNPSCKSRLCT